MTPGLQFHIRSATRGSATSCRPPTTTRRPRLPRAKQGNHGRPRSRRCADGRFQGTQRWLRVSLPTITSRLPVDVSDAEIRWTARCSRSDCGTPLPLDAGRAASRPARRIARRAPPRSPSRAAGRSRSKVLFPPIPFAATASPPLPNRARRGARRAPRAVVASSGALPLVGFGVASLFVAWRQVNRPRRRSAPPFHVQWPERPRFEPGSPSGRRLDCRSRYGRSRRLSRTRPGYPPGERCDAPRESGFIQIVGSF